ncbi:MAG: hypothetical protein P8Y80_05185 [Acidobacteriota bacterium]
MKLSWKKVAVIGLPVALFLLVSLVPAQDRDAGTGTSRVTSPPVGTTAGQSRRTGADPVDDRVELREYLFTDTDEMLPYAVFVSSKVTKDKKAPLVLALHGFSGNHGTFMRTQCVDEAEKNGYILIGAMGYSPSGSFGMPMGVRGAPGKRVGAPGARSGPSPQGKPQPGAVAASEGQPKRGMFMGMGWVRSTLISGPLLPDWLQPPSASSGVRTRSSGTYRCWSLWARMIRWLPAHSNWPINSRA